MSDIAPVLKDGFGVPLTWIYSTNGEMLKDYYGKPISVYVKELTYTYDEEDDDECEIVFQFEDMANFSLPYFQQDVVLVVQWGYLTEAGKFIKSPKRKVAIRDIDTDYGTKGIIIKLHCTDLVAYIKGFKTQTMRRYENPNAKNALDAIGKAEDNFLDWLKESGEGLFKPTVTMKDKATRWDLRGQQRNATYNAKTGVYTVARDNARVSKEFFTEFHTAKVIKGKSKALSQAILDQLKFLNAQGGLGGPFIPNTTDDTLHIHQRNFIQKPFKTYTFAKGTGELLQFKSKTNTRKTKEDTSTSTGVNPYNKKIEKSEINLADTATLDKDKKLSSDTTTINKEESLKQYYKEARKTFKDNIQNPEDQKELPDLTYIKINERAKNAGFYDESRFTAVQLVTVPSNEVLDMPEFQKLTEDGKNTSKSDFKREQVLIGYSVEKIQRKYEANVKVVGDPSLIKSKIYGFLNLGRLDNGYWYATTVKHTIKTGGEYLCELDVIKKPSTVGINKQSHKAKIKINGDEIEWENEIESQDVSIYEDEIDEVTLINNMDTTKKKPFQQQDISDIETRLQYLNAEADFVLGTQDNVLKKDEYDELNNPNAKNY